MRWYYYPTFIDKETEAHKDKVTSSRSHSPGKNASQAPVFVLNYYAILNPIFFNQRKTVRDLNWDYQGMLDFPSQRYVLLLHWTSQNILEKIFSKPYTLRVFLQSSVCQVTILSWLSPHSNYSISPFFPNSS